MGTKDQQNNEGSTAIEQKPPIHEIPSSSAIVRMIRQFVPLTNLLKLPVRVE